MKRLQAFKYELMPNGEQEQGMRRFAGARRFVYNKALALQKTNYEAGGKFIRYVAMANLLPKWKDEFPWLRESPSHTLQQSLKDAERAFKNFFEKRTAFPRFKKKGGGDSFRFPDVKQFDIDQANNRIKFPKLGQMRYRNSRDIFGSARNITVSKSGDKWFASIQTEREVEQPVPVTTSAIGIDMGLVRFATLSDGSFIAPLGSFKKHEQRLKKCQRRMSRKVKFSKNWHKAKRKVQKIHTRVKNARKDFLHKATTEISKNHAMVAVEDLQVRNMSKSAQGTTEAPGKNVAQKSGLNKAILDQGWGEFRRQLAYKLNWRGAMLIAVPAHYTSQTCPACGHVARENRQTQALFACVDCGHAENADVVGAMNVLARGYRVAACGEDGSGSGRKTRTKPASVKQEPTEVTIREVTHV